MKLKLFLFFVLLSIIWYSYGNYNDSTPYYIKLANNVRYNAVKKIKKKYKVKQFGIHDGFDSCVLKSGASFLFEGKLQKNEARSLIVSIVEIYLNEFNENKEIRPFLKNYPFKLEDIDIVIFSGRYNGERLYEPYIGVISCEDGYVYYKIYDSDNEYAYKSVARESFDEALSVLRSQ